MIRKIFHTDSNNWAPLALRVLLGGVLFAHGAQKLTGWFGGYGFEGTMQFFTETKGLPWIVGFAVIIIEFFGSLSLIAGFATRLWSAAIIGLTIGIVLTSHTDYFFMNWFGNQKTEGMEFFLLAIGMASSLVYSGAGRLSIDAQLGNYARRKANASAGFLPA